MGARTKTASFLRTNAIASLQNVPSLNDLRGQPGDATSPAKADPAQVAAFARQCDELRDAVAQLAGQPAHVAGWRPVAETLSAQ